MKLTLLKPLLFAAVALSSGWLGAAAQAATPYSNATVAGSLLPGVYGRIEIGTMPPPPLIYPQPVIIYPAPQVVQQPLYLHVPPGHAKKWSKHCAKYNACGQPVYFVRVDGDEGYERARYMEYKEKKEKKDKHHGKEKGNENGNGNNKGKGKHDD